MITIKIYQKKWQIHLSDEIWQFETTKEFSECLEQLIIFKEKYGKFNNSKCQH